MQTVQFKARGTQDRITVWFFNAMVIAAAVIVLYPLYFVVIASVSDPAAVNSGKALLWPAAPSLTGYKYIFADERIWTGYRNTAVYTFFGTLLGLFMTILGGYALSRRDLPGRGAIMKLYVFTMYFGGGLIPTYLVVRQLHLVNNPLVMIILGSFSVFNLIVTRTFFMTKIPYEFLDAASIDGCGNGRFFLSIVLPLSKEIIAVIALYYAVGHWNSFFNALIYLNQQKYYSLQLFLRDLLLTSQAVAADAMEADALVELRRIAESIKYGIIIVSSLPVMILYPFLQKYFAHGVMIGGIKE
jgi:putative aldouronate transport system permease protein